MYMELWFPSSTKAAGALLFAFAFAPASRVEKNHNSVPYRIYLYSLSR
jgi:hypothetical protein